MVTDWTDRANGQAGRNEAFGSPKPAPVLRPIYRRCFICSSPSHFASACPQRGSEGGFKPKPVPRPQVNTCKTRTQPGMLYHNPPYKSSMTNREVGSQTASVQNDRDQSMRDGNTTSVTRSESVVNHLKITDDVTSSVMTETFDRMSGDRVTEAGIDESQLPSINYCPDVDLESDSNPPSDPDLDELLRDGWSQLRYVDVTIDGLPGSVVALQDSGAQLCVTRADTIKSLCLPRLGEVKLKGLLTDTVPADIVRIRVKLAAGNGFESVTCAVVNDLNCDLILGEDVVNRLNLKLIHEQSAMVVLSVSDVNPSTEVVSVDPSLDGPAEVEPSPGSSEDHHSNSDGDLVVAPGGG